MKRKIWLTLLLALTIGVAMAVAQPPDEQNYPGPGDTGQNQDMKHVSVKGRIERITGQSAVLMTKDGEDVTVHLGPQRFWRDRDYHLNTGADVTVDGWGEVYGEDGGFIYAGRIYGNGYSIELMDSRGYPMWADRDDWSDDWCPSYSVFQLYFGPPWGYGPWGYWGPPPRWWRPHGWWQPGWRHHDRPYDRPHRPPPPRHQRHGRW
jgi:hypothetical protein